MPSPKQLVVGAVGLGLSVTGLSFLATPTAHANPDGTALVISEVYGAGGNGGATFNADFVELYNPTDEDISLSGLAIHYRAANGNSGGPPFALSGSVPAGEHWLIQMSATGGNGVALPTPDTTASFSMAAAGGQVALQEGTTIITTSGDTSGTAGIVDFVGASGAASFEGAPAGAASSTSSLNRDEAGTDTDNNADDFSLAAPSPTNSGGEGGGPGGGGDPVEATIAEVQGTGAASPMVGDTVITEGVVTATYPTGGFNGFYLQTPGPDTTPGASDGVFVFGPTFDESTLEIGDSVEVEGVVSEFGTLTEITASTVTEVADLGDVEPNTTIPGTDCALPGTACLTGAALEAAREEHEGEAFLPTGDFTVTDVHDGSAYNPPNSTSNNFFGEIGLAANSTEPLVTPTEIIDAQDTDAIAARVAYNNAHRVVLDDGSSTTYWNTDNPPTVPARNTPFPYHTPDHHVRVGAAVTFDQPVILDYRFGWKVQPAEQVVEEPTGLVTFEQGRPAAPEEVGGDFTLATFNVLNYFTTLGEDLAGCQPYVDRENNPIAVRTGCDARGAWDEESFDRQETKIVNAINALDADIVSVEEIENSLVVDGHDRDEALSTLVDALNDDAGSDVWDYVASPASASEPANVAEQDVIRTGFIYKPAAVEQVGEADMLFGEAVFDNAREPFAAVFRPAGGAEGSEFAVIVNHFKSKGSGANDGTGQGNANPDRIAQAEALSAYADELAADRGVEAVFLTGDFNAYSQEDPMQVLYEDGYSRVAPEGEHSYNFDGQVGSLDHVVANEAAAAMVDGVDIWEINANETVFNQYSRYNYNATILYTEQPYSASDHNPEIVGLDALEADGPKQIQVLGINDFHGRLAADGNNAAGAAVLAGAVKELEADYPTVFAAAGDLIGASTFESFIQKDKPTIDALNEAGLDVSAVGNHELDQGYEDLVDRVMNADHPEGGAEWEYISANLTLTSTGDPAVPATWMTERDGVQVGFVGATTEELKSLVSPGGIADITVEDIVESTNQYADELRADGADIVVMLVHEGASSTSCDTMDDDPASAFGSIVTGVDDDVDAIISGHTHLAYNCEIGGRPVVSAGQYGTALNQLVFDVDPATNEVLDVTAALLPLVNQGYTPDPVVEQIVADAKTEADVLGAVELGQIEDRFGRAKLPVPAPPPAPPLADENRGGESTLGNLVAEVQRWATETQEAGSAQIAFMNPGGLRADMDGSADGDGPRDVTYRQAANVQPFANTLINMQLTGAQIETVLEQQWQRTTAGAVPSRPFLKLGVSEGFKYTYVETPVTVGSTETFQGEVTGMWLDGEPIDPEATYSVTVNSFLSTGGDNFHELANGTQKRDTGKVDLQAMVDYMEEFANTEEGDEPLPVDYEQRGVEVEFPEGAPEVYEAGDQVVFDVASLAMSGRVNPEDPVYDVQDDTILVMLDGEEIGSAPVDNTIGTVRYDQYGTAHVDVTLPVTTPVGEVELLLVGPETGTEVIVPITVAAAVPAVVNETAPTVTGKAQVGKTLTGTPGEWTPEAEDVAFQWLADGTPIAGATGTRLKLRAGHVGKRISLRVTASADGYTDGVATSAATPKVAKGSVRMTAKVTPKKVKVRKTRAWVTVTVANADGIKVGGTVTVNAKGIKKVSKQVVNGRVRLRLPAFGTKGKKVLTIRYAGSAALKGATVKRTIRVRR
ncbi:ExeM/NucH family extracellular endonuclease (plasmid) [Georgenia sp. TF02-10]|uniref:ExeM/NucH family extracellular endonuclease n=1 Tax=Georgenia sp. TF02-10 TaxID=2917725 RepID=UPI001FA6AE5E|nr:ExeM/NucH family extracellular endonuclease [Georgenia sp. TF02-10]UNX56567.1 ExeM/NucH family extracellular endonuclease [Georgenia sp. TF02-10]